MLANCYLKDNQQTIKLVRENDIDEEFLKSWLYAEPEITEQRHYDSRFKHYSITLSKET